MRPHRSLTRPSDFRRIARTGQILRAEGVTVHSVPADQTLIGLAVRVPGAVRRNRIKRRLRAAAAEGLRGPVAVVVRADERALVTDFQELVSVFERVSEAA